MSLLEEAKYLLRSHRIVPNSLLGQNFMVDSSVYPRLVDYASLNSSDVVLDIGAGFGFLTRFLAGRCKGILAVETDPKIAKVLRERLVGLPTVSVIEGNVLKVPIPLFNKIISIPPYHISSRLFVWLFDKKIDCAVLILQKEFANRLVANIGSEDYGWLTVLAYYYYETELLDAVPKQMFHPEPEVDSVVVRLRARQSPPFNVKNERLFRQLARSLFAQRNKKVRNSVLSFLKGVLGMKEDDAAKLALILPFCGRRARELAPEDFGALANALSS